MGETPTPVWVRYLNNCWEGIGEPEKDTINERVGIATIENCWRYTIHLLGRMAECK